MKSLNQNYVSNGTCKLCGSETSEFEVPGLRTLVICTNSKCHAVAKGVNSMIELSQMDIIRLFIDRIQTVGKLVSKTVRVTGTDPTQFTKLIVNIGLTHGLNETGDPENLSVVVEDSTWVISIKIIREDEDDEVIEGEFVCPPNPHWKGNDQVAFFKAFKRILMDSEFPSTLF